MLPERFPAPAGSRIAAHEAEELNRSPGRFPVWLLLLLSCVVMVAGGVYWLNSRAVSSRIARSKVQIFGDLAQVAAQHPVWFAGQMVAGRCGRNHGIAAFAACLDACFGASVVAGFLCQLVVAFDLGATVKNVRPAAGCAGNRRV